jgi:tetratricopeptide (TPR) repeat protein/energy-coupling factor transporter ATP-binding protein EcfA2
MQPGASFNPFPGLRAFEPEEDYLFFGREQAIDELLKRLRASRFLVVTGASGSGKSSLVRSGLIPSLYRGFMTGAGSSWRVAIFRPGEDPLGRLASSLQTPELLGAGDESSRMLLRITLERGALGLVEAVQEARIPPNENVLVVVDQFEELFRFQERRDSGKGGEEAIAFVKLLLEAAHQSVVPIFVVITIRADYLGQCMRYPALPEAINAGQYLVPRMSRDELRRAITAPVAIGGGGITPRLVIRLLNDSGDDPEQLPVLQHALMRTWDYWQAHRAPGEPMDTPHYEAIGTMKNALSMHADEAYQEAASSGKEDIARTIFKALTDTSSNASGVRRPTSVHDLAEIASASEKDIVSTVEIFQRAGRSFLTPPPDTPMRSSTVVDLTHESLMRVWSRLKEWAEEERISTDRYLRVSRAAHWYEEGTAGLFRNPELGMALKWRAENRPTAAWARRLDPGFELAMAFLDRSQAEDERLRAAREKERRRQIVQARAFAAVLGVLLIVAVILAVAAYRYGASARQNLAQAEDAVNQMLASAGNDTLQFEGEPPELKRFRAELLKKANRFYEPMRKENRTNQSIRYDVALAHFHSGDIYRLQEQFDRAIAEYQIAIEQFTRLSRDSAGKPEYVERLALAYNWLGEAQRTKPQRTAEDDAAAIRNYDQAIDLLEKLRHDFPQQTEYVPELARTYDNRGIMYKWSDDPDRAAKDFQAAIEILKPLAERPAALPEYLQDLARSENNLSQLMRDDQMQGDAAAPLQDAIRLGERLRKADPDNRQYKTELARYYDNFALLLQDQGKSGPSQDFSQRSLQLFGELAAPAPSVQLEGAHAHSIRAMILAEAGAKQGAHAEYEAALEGFRELAKGSAPPEYDSWYGAALESFADLEDAKAAVPLLQQAVEHRRAAKDTYYLVWDLYSLAAAYAALGSTGPEREAIDSATALLPQLHDADRQELTRLLEIFQHTKSKGKQ